MHFGAAEDYHLLDDCKEHLPITTVLCEMDGNNGTEITDSFGGAN